MHLPASAFLFELVHFTLDECAGRNGDLVSGVDRKGDLSVDIVSAMDGSALDRIGEHKRNPSSGWDDYRRTWSRLLLRLWIRFLFGLRLILCQAGEG